MITGAVLDMNYSTSAKSKVVYLGILILVTGSWIWNAVVEADLSARSEPPSLDLGDGGFFNSAFAVYMLFKLFYEAMQTYLYWLLGAKRGTQENGAVSRMTGIMRSWESIGSAIAYGIGATNVSDLNQMIIAFALWAFTVPFTMMAVFGRCCLTDEIEPESELSGSDLEEAAVGPTEKE